MAVHQVVPLQHHSGCKQLRPCSNFVAELQVGQDAGVVLQPLQPPSSPSHCHVLVVSRIVCVGNIDVCKIVIVVVVIVVVDVVGRAERSIDDSHGKGHECKSR